MPIEVIVKNIEISDTKRHPQETIPRHSGTVHLSVKGASFGYFEAQSKFVDVPGGLSNAITRALEEVKAYSQELTQAVERELSLYRAQN